MHRDNQFILRITGLGRCTTQVKNLQWDVQWDIQWDDQWDGKFHKNFNW